VVLKDAWMGFPNIMVSHTFFLKHCGNKVKLQNKLCTLVVIMVMACHGHYHQKHKLLCSSSVPVIIIIIRSTSIITITIDIIISPSVPRTMVTMDGS
jgi:hypothetical protein